MSYCMPAPLSACWSLSQAYIRLVDLAYRSICEFHLYATCCACSVGGAPRKERESFESEHVRIYVIKETERGVRHAESMNGCRDGWSYCRGPNRCHWRRERRRSSPAGKSANCQTNEKDRQIVVFKVSSSSEFEQSMNHTSLWLVPKQAGESQ